jgi:fructosamine-3-kinase
MTVYVKRNPAAPPGFFACEAAGLQWLAAAAKGARCAGVIAVDDTSLTLERLQTARPASVDAMAFGRALARTHDAGAEAWGTPPDAWTGPGYFGPLAQPLPMSYTTHRRWGGFYANERLEPMVWRARGVLSPATVADLENVIKRCRAGGFDDEDAPARIHGDLWSGNLIWTAKGVVLIDPAAHGGHREADIAMLHLFGCPHLNAVVDGYQQVHPLGSGWRDRLPLHQLYPLLAHVVLFGAGYARQTHAAAVAALNIS